MGAQTKEKESVFVHPLGVCDSRTVGEGTRVWAFAHVMPGARIGRNCNLGEHVFVENEVSIGDGCTIKNNVSVWDLVTLEADVFVGPQAVFTNDLKPRAFLKRGHEALVPTRVKRGATLGANCTIVCGITIGEYSMIAAGAIVTKDVPPHTMVIGTPAKPVWKICFCGERLDPKDFCTECKLSLSENSASRVIETLSKKHG